MNLLPVSEWPQGPHEIELFKTVGRTWLSTIRNTNFQSKVLGMLQDWSAHHTSSYLLPLTAGNIRFMYYCYPLVPTINITAGGACIPDART